MKTVIHSVKAIIVMYLYKNIISIRGFVVDVHGAMNLAIRDGATKPQALNAKWLEAERGQLKVAISMLQLTTNYNWWFTVGFVLKYQLCVCVLSPMQPLITSNVGDIQFDFYHIPISPM